MDNGVISEVALNIPDVLKSRHLPPSSPNSLRPNVTLRLVHPHHVLVNILQHEIDGFREVRDVPHLELCPVSKEKDHVAIAEQSLDGAYLHDVGVHNLGHVLPPDSGGDAYATVGDGVPNPRLSRPRSGGGDDADDGEDGYRRGDGLGDRGGTLVERLLGSEGGKCRGGGGRRGLATLSLPSLGLRGRRMGNGKPGKSMWN